MGSIIISTDRSTFTLIHVGIVPRLLFTRCDSTTSHIYIYIVQQQHKTCMITDTQRKTIVEQVNAPPQQRTDDAPSCE